ncbi:MAG: hypothetical protein IJ458_00270 [Clostridia bacterium]|nr:hypothetical protein [Clostridia bacterium]
MKNTFVEDLWEKFPEQTINAIKKICLVNEKWGDSLEFNGFEDGALIFKKTGRSPDRIVVSNFAIRTTYSSKNYQDSPMSIAWVKFMFSIYGGKYAMQYISQRNMELDKFMAEYEEKYNAQTRKVLVQMGFGKEKGQTK